MQWLTGSFCLALMLLTTPTVSAQQCQGNAAPLDAPARRAFSQVTPVARSRTAAPGYCAALRYTRMGARRNVTAARNDAGRAYSALGQRDYAGTQFRRALALQDTSVMREVSRLIRTSPVLEPSRSLAQEAAFIRDVRALLRRFPDGAQYAPSVRSVNDAMAVLEAISEQRMATIKVLSPQRGFSVNLRRWSYRDSRTIPWTPVRADTSLRLPAVTYQFRYRLPGTSRDTIVDVPCADGCDVRFPD
jgi:hypothetical protein